MGFAVSMIDFERSLQILVTDTRTWAVTIVTRSVLLAENGPEYSPKSSDGWMGRTVSNLTEGEPALPESAWLAT